MCTGAINHLCEHNHFGKLAWGIVGLIGLSIALSHSPALIGIAALVVLYYGYREWKKEKDVVVDSAPESSKPYSNFEDEWNKLMKTNIKSIKFIK